jgi:hypothetical protein
MVTWRRTYDFDRDVLVAQTRVVPIGIFTAPVCLALLVLNRERTTRGDRIAGVVACAGLAYGSLRWLLS